MYICNRYAMYMYVCISVVYMTVINVKEWSGLRNSGNAVKFVDFSILFNDIPNAAICPLFCRLTRIVYYRYNAPAVHKTTTRKLI